MTFVLAHISDLHLPPLPHARPQELLGKRLLSWLSWHSKRKAVHRPEVLEALLDDLQEQAPNHIALTGDLVNLSLPAEFAAAARLLERLAPPERLTLVPGNHDHLVRQSWEQSWGHWQAYLPGTPASRGAAGFADPFPTLTRRGNLALVGLSSAVPTAPTLASGRLGQAQLERLDRMLAALNQEAAQVIILIHHSPVAGRNSRRKALSDAGALRDILAQRGCSLLLHGHDHRFLQDELAGANGPFPVLGVASGSALAWHGRPAAGYHLLRFAEDGSLELRRRGYDPEGGRFLERDSRTLALPGRLR